MLSLIAGFMAEIVVLSYSAAFAGNQVAAGLPFKLVSYVCVLIGLVVARDRAGRPASAVAGERIERQLMATQEA